MRKIPQKKKLRIIKEYHKIINEGIKKLEKDKIVLKKKKLYIDAESFVKEFFEKKGKDNLWKKCSIL